MAQPWGTVSGAPYLTPTEATSRVTDAVLVSSTVTSNAATLETVKADLGRGCTVS